jgi:hypothetical protein
MKHLILITFLLASLNNIQAQSDWVSIKETVIKGSIKGTITQGYVFKISSSEYFIVYEKTKHKVYTLNPKVKIFQNGSIYKLVIEDFEEPVICKKIEQLIETQIKEEFNGWEGETIFKMDNGQIWKQFTYAYKYHYSYKPSVLIYEYNGSWILKVDGVDETIQVTQIN